MANFINDNFKPYLPIAKDNIITASGVTPIEDMLAFNLADPGDGILVSAPIYGRFELDFGNEARVKIVYASMEDVDSFEVGVVERFEVAFNKAEKAGTMIRAILISNPSNPLGSPHCHNFHTRFDKFYRRVLSKGNSSGYHDIL
jgi:1-aminocyclopropane-1-carboxylate synthase